MCILVRVRMCMCVHMCVNVHACMSVYVWVGEWSRVCVGGGWKRKEMRV